MLILKQWDSRKSGKNLCSHKDGYNKHYFNPRKRGGKNFPKEGLFVLERGKFFLPRFRPSYKSLPFCSNAQKSHLFLVIPPIDTYLIPCYYNVVL